MLHFQILAHLLMLQRANLYIEQNTLTSDEEASRNEKKLLLCVFIQKEIGGLNYFSYFCTVNNI